MAIENEIKYILPPTFNAKALDEKGWLQIPVRQGYLDNGPRIRQYGDEYLFTYKRWIKSEQKLVEIETPISEQDFKRLWPECDNFISKTRYLKQSGSYEWAVDFLQDENGDVYFVLAEVEMPEDVKKPDNIPTEIADHILFQAPQGDDTYTNIKLADPAFARDLLAKLPSRKP